MTRILTLSEWNKNYFFQRRTSKPAINKLAPLAENIVTIMRILQEQMNLKSAHSYLLSLFKQNFTNKLFLFVMVGICSWC